MKARRQMKILELIGKRVIETQEELAAQLRQQGIEVTQATVSRDIKELRLIKVPSGDGRYKYAVPEEHSGSAQRLRRLLRDYVVSFAASENLLVVKTLSATAPGVAEAIDSLGWSEILGTLAGDNTVLVVLSSRDIADVIQTKLENMMR